MSAILDRLLVMAQRIPELTPKKMFGYDYFFLNTHAVAGAQHGYLWLYLDEVLSAEFLQIPGTERSMFDDPEPAAGWHIVKRPAALDDALIQHWLERAASFAVTRPPVVRTPRKRKTAPR